MAANGLLRYILSSAFPLFTVQREQLFLDPSIPFFHHYKRAVSLLTYSYLERAAYY